MVWQLKKKKKKKKKYGKGRPPPLAKIIGFSLKTKTKYYSPFFGPPMGFFLKIKFYSKFPPG